MSELIVKPLAYTSKKGLSSELITDFCGMLPVRTCMCFGDNDHLFDQPIYLHPVIKNGGAPIPEIIEQVKALDAENWYKNQGDTISAVVEILERYR